MKGNVLTRGLTRGATYNASVLDYYTNLQKEYEQARRLLAEYEKKKREYEKQRKDSEEKKAKLLRDRKAYLEKLRKTVSAEERENAAVRALKKWGNGETPDQKDIDLFEISDYKKSLTDHSDDAWYEKAWRGIKDFFLGSDGITATGWKMNDIQASQFSGNIAKSREDLLLLDMAEDYYKGNRTSENIQAIQELNRRKPGIINTAAVYANKALDWIGNNPIIGTTGAFLGTDELDKVRTNIDFDENTTSELALLNITALRDAYKLFDKQSYDAYLENHNKAKYYENLLSSEYKRKLNIAEGRIADENGVVDGSVDFFNFSKLGYLLPGIIAGSISSPSQLLGSFATGAATAAGILATTAAASAAIAGTGGLATPAVLGGLTAVGAGATFGLNQALGAHENAAEVDEGYVSKVKYALEQHPGAAADFYKKGRSVLGNGATIEDIIVAKLVNKIPASNKIIDKIFDDAAIGSQRLYDRDMVATTGDSTIDTALQITPLKFFTNFAKTAIKANLRSSRIARAANKIGDKLAKLNAGDEGVLRKAFGRYGALVSGEGAAFGATVGTVLDNILGRIPKVNTAIKSMMQFDIAKIKRFGPKTSNWLSYGGSVAGRGIKSAISEGVEEGKQYYNQQRAVQEFQDGLKNGNLSYETQSILGDVLDDFLAGDFAASGLVQAITGIPLLDYLHYTDTNIINAAEAIKNIKSGMVGGHGQTTAMTAINGFLQTAGTHGAIDDMELAIRALENNKLTAQKLFAVDLILSRTNSKYISSAIEYLKNSNSIKLSEKELEDLQTRATEVKGISDSPVMKALAKRLNIPKEDYHKFVADYMYHKDNLDTEGENLRNAVNDLDAKANEIKAESEKVANPSDVIFKEWLKNDRENDKLRFENNKTNQIKKLQDHLRTLNDKLEKEALTNSQKAEILEQISSVEESLLKAEEAKFNESEEVSYAQARFDRINTLARIRGGIKLLNFLNTILSAIDEDNVTGRKFVQKQIDAAKKLLNTWLTGSKIEGRQLTADNLEDIDTFTKDIARNIERADKDNMFLMGASAELSGQIESLSQAYQEHSKAVLNYNIASDLFNNFVGYNVNEKGEIVPEGTEGSKYIKGNAKEHLEGIISAQDDDAKLEQAYKLGFSDYGFAGVYKNESPLVQDEERQEEEVKPGTAERRQTIKDLGNKIRTFASKARNYVSGKWNAFGNKKVFVPDEPEERTTLDPSENQLDVREYYNRIVEDYKNADDIEKWLNAASIDDNNPDVISNAHLLIDAYLDTWEGAGNILRRFGDADDRTVDIYFNDVKIGSITPFVVSNKAEGDAENIIRIEEDGFDLDKIKDISYLENLIKPQVEPERNDSSVTPPLPPKATASTNITEQQELKILALNDLAEKMNNKFDVSLRTSSHYFEWIGTGENRKLKLWHRLHDEIGSHFYATPQDRKNWSDTIKKLYSVVYHKGYSEENPEGSKDVQALLNHLQNFYQNEMTNEQLLDRIEGYIIYLKQEGDDISDKDLYECIKGISEEIAQEIGGKNKNKSLDRGTAVDDMCRTVFGTSFSTPQEAIEYCKTLKMVDQSGREVFVKDYFTNEAFEDAITHLWNTRKVYVEDLGYVLWTAPFTIYTEDFTNEDGSHINIAGEIDMLAIDKEGRPIIIDYKTSKYSFFKDGKLSVSFTSVGSFVRSPQEQYINLQSAYIQMLNETTRKETGFTGGFNCNEARLLPIHLVSLLTGELVSKAKIEFSKDQQLTLQTIPFKELGEKENLIFDKETYRSKLAQLSKLYAKIDYIADHLNIYYTNAHSNALAEQIRSIKKDLDSILLSLQDITGDDILSYEEKIINSAILGMLASYFGNLDVIDNVCKRYAAGELELDEAEKARSYNNLNWDNPINDNDIDKLGGFSAMGVKDRQEYDEKVEELAHVSCNKDFLNNATAKLTAVPYKTRRGNDKIAVYAAITYKNTTYPPIRIYLSETNGEAFAKDVLNGNTVGANIRTTVGLLSNCSDGNQHLIGENKQLVDAIGGTEENPYGDFMVDTNNNLNIAVVTFNKSTGVLSTVSGDPDSETEIALPRTLKKASANGHIVINIIPENSGMGRPVPIICNTPKINESVGVSKANHRTQSLLDFLAETVLPGLNDIEGGNPLNEKVKVSDGEELPLTYKQLLNFFFEPYNPQNGDLIERPQYQILAPMPGQESRRIKIGNFSKTGEGGAKIISLDDTTALKNAIRQLSVWISTEMASVKWNSSKRGSKLFNEFAKFLSKLEDGERFYLGDTNIYFDKSDADGTYLGFLAKNGLLTTPFNGFSHPLISINTCQKEDVPVSPAVREVDENKQDSQKLVEQQGKVSEEDLEGNILEQYGDIVNMYSEDDDPYAPKFNKLLSGRDRLDETAARQYVEKVLGKQFNNLLFVDEICSAIVGGLSAGTIIAGQVTANMMKLSRYAQNGTEYHEAFHWVFELIIDPKDSNKIRNIVRKRYGITDERLIAEWLADAYMHYVRKIYTPNGNLLQKAFAKIRQWAITFERVFTGEYQMYKLFNSINSGKFANKPINNEAVLRFLEKLKELNSKIPTLGFEKDGISYSYQLGPTDHEQNIKLLAFFALSNATFSPAVTYATNSSVIINIKNIFNNNFVKKIMMVDHYDGKKFIKGLTKEQLVKARENPKNRAAWRIIDNALALRELLDDEHIDKTQEYVSAYIDRIIGVKGKDLSVNGKDDSSEETNMDQSYADTEAGDDSSYAGSPKEHIIPDHQISRISKTSSRIKLFFATIPNFKPNEYGKLGYYNLHDIYQAVQNRYYHVMSPEALWNAIETDSKNNPMISSLWNLISRVKHLASKGNDNAIGLLNEIYRSIKSTKQSHEVTKTRREPGERLVTYRSVNIMVQNNSFAISREFTDTVLGNFNKFYEQVLYKDENRNDAVGYRIRSLIYDESTDSKFGPEYRDAAYEAFFGSGYNTFLDVIETIDKESGKPVDTKVKRPIFSIYDVVSTYGTKNQHPLYIKDNDKRGYREVSVEDNMPYIKFRLAEALSSVGIDVTVDQIDDILETQFGGTGILQMKQLLTERFTLPTKGNTHKAGAKVTLREAVTKLYSLINAEILNGGGMIKVRRETRGGRLISVNGLDVFRNQLAHVLLSTLISTALQQKYEVSARGVDGKLSYAMSDDNTVTAMCDVIFDKTGDPQCTKIRQMIMNDPFNMSDGTVLFGKIPVGSYILPRIIDGDTDEILKYRDKTQFPQIGESNKIYLDVAANKTYRWDKNDDRYVEIKKADDVDYEIVNDAGIETGNNENSSTNADKRGADTIISIITKLCLNMIVLAPFADKSTALSVRLHGIKIPGIDYDRVSYTFRETGKEDTLLDDFRSYIQAITVDETGRVVLGDKNNTLDETIAQYVLAEYYQAKKAILDYEDILRNGAEDNKTALNICKKLMFMSQFSGDYVQNEETGEWTFKPFSVENGSKKTDLDAAKEMISQFEEVVNDKKSLLSFVNRHINGMLLHELEKLQEYDIINKTVPNAVFPNPHLKNVLLDRNVLRCIYTAINQKRLQNSEKLDATLVMEQAIRIFMYDVVGKSIISKQESERLFTGLSDLYEIIRDKETRIITIPYQDQAKRIGSFASTGSVGVIDDEEYTCAEIPDDKQSIKDQIVRSVYANEIAHYIKTGELDMNEHPGFDFRFATSDLLRELIPNEFRPLIDRKVENIMRGFVLLKKDGSENKNNVTDGVSFISANFAKKLLKSQGAWNHKIAKAFDRLTSDKKQDIHLILNDWETFNEVFTQVIGTLKYTAVGFRAEKVNGQEKSILYVNKTALFPVFACMCNEKMDAIRRQMEELHVDMLMFESAVKVGAHGNSNFTVDDRGNTTGHFNTYSQKSFFLRKQLNTDPNEKEKMKIGIQTVKVALSAAIGEKEIEWRGEIVDGDTIIKLIMNDIDALTTKRSDKLMSKLRTQKDVVNYVSRFLRGNNVPEHVIEAFLSGIPAEALSIQKHIDTLSAKRILEDIVRIDSPGSAFIQRCVYGVEGPNVKFGSLELNDGEELKVVNADGSMDCVLSIDYFIEYRNGVPYFKLTPGKNKTKLTVYDTTINKERPMSFEEIRQWLKKTGVIGKNAKPAILSYRIPTQAVASINALKCVDVIPVVRDSVILPKLFTTITGADFDIDKLFLSTVWYNMQKEEDGSYLPQQIEDSATEEGLSNIVINDYIDILCVTARNHPEIFYRSIDEDTKLADDVISWIKEKYPPTKKDILANASGILLSMPSVQAKVHDEFLAGKLGIGPFALALVNHVLTRIYKVGFNSKGIYLKNKSLARDTDDDGNSIMSWLSAMINKHVDVAKNPDITYLNVNDSTFNVIALLLRLGYGRRTFMFACQDIMRDYAFAINQETSVCKYTKNDNGYTDDRKQAYDKIIERYKLSKIELRFKNVNDNYSAACREIFDRNIENKSLCEYVLEHHGKVPSGITVRIGKEDVKLTDLLFQFLILQLFNYLSDFMAKPLTALLQASVIDNERCITSMILSEFYKQSVEKVKQSLTFSNINALFENSYIDGKIRETLNGMDAIYEASSSMDKDVVTTVAKQIDPNILQYGKDRMNTFLSIVRDGMVAYYGAKFFDDYCRKNNIDIQQIIKAGPKGIVRRLADILASTRSVRGKYRSLRNNLLIRGLSTEGIIGEQYTEDPGEMFYNKHRFMNYLFLRFKYAGQSDDNMLADVLLAWELLLNYPDEKIQNFARDLIIYSFYTSGEMSGTTKLFKYVPPSWRLSSGYSDFFDQLVRRNRDDLYKNIDDIIDKLCRNLWYREKFVRTMSRSMMARFLGSDILKSHTRTMASTSDAIGDSEIVVNKDPIFSPVIAGIQYTEKGNVYPIFKGDKDNCPRYIKVVDDHHDRLTGQDDSASAWTLYRLVGFNTYVDKNQNSWQYPVYIQTSVLGEKYYRNNIFEYNEQLEPNENLDAYGIMTEFLSKLGHRTHTSADINSVLEDLTKLLEIVNLGVNLDLTGSESEIAEQTINILVDKQTGRTTFLPLKTRDEFLEKKQKALEKQQEKICNRS